MKYSIQKDNNAPAYLQLYKQVREDIISGIYPYGTKLPSKRLIASETGISTVTVEHSYALLCEEGYIESRERSGYFVSFRTEDIFLSSTADVVPVPEALSHHTDHNTPEFPFSVLAKTMRSVLSEYEERVLDRSPNFGCTELRDALRRYLLRSRGISADTEQIIIGSGSEYLYSLLVELLGREKAYALESPSYKKIEQVYHAADVRTTMLPLGTDGIKSTALRSCNADVLHISPSHHFPTGLVTSLSRRQDLLAWAKAEPERWIIEDDYDSEFRFASRPLPAMQSLDGSRVIYMNTFSKTLAPSIRISYMVLPVQLMEKLQEKLGFYSCTVPSFEQHTLARFLDEGYFEKHINRMRKFYKTRRNRILAAIAACPMAEKLSILEENAGLHFLVRVNSPMTDAELEKACRSMGIRVRCLSSYYAGAVPAWAERCLVVNYSGLSDEALAQLEEKLGKGF